MEPPLDNRVQKFEWMDRSDQIKIIKAKIALLDVEKERLFKKLGNIEKERSSPINSLSAILASPSHQPISLDKKLDFSQEQQINLFRSLFRGRDDVYARLWVSKKQAKADIALYVKTNG